MPISEACFGRRHGMCIGGPGLQVPCDCLCHSAMHVEAPSFGELPRPGMSAVDDPLESLPWWVGDYPKIPWDAQAGAWIKDDELALMWLAQACRKFVGQPNSLSLAMRAACEYAEYVLGYRKEM